MKKNEFLRFETQTQTMLGLTFTFIRKSEIMEVHINFKDIDITLKNGDIQRFSVYSMTEEGKTYLESIGMDFSKLKKL